MSRIFLVEIFFTTLSSTPMKMRRKPCIFTGVEISDRTSAEHLALLEFAPKRQLVEGV